MGMGVPSSVRDVRDDRRPAEAGVASVITEQSLLLQTLERRRIGDQLLFQSFLDRGPGEGGETTGTGLDAVAAAVPTVPDAATWALMVVGFGMIGGSLRRRSTTTVVSA